jgi:hypothetical protein
LYKKAIEEFSSKSSSSSNSTPMKKKEPEAEHSSFFTPDIIKRYTAYREDHKLNKLYLERKRLSKELDDHMRTGKPADKEKEGSFRHY